ncbi:MAG: LytTR family DNA-binding domain-containing protein, partial [Pseudomonadota bacterium]
MPAVNVPKALAKADPAQRAALAALPALVVAYTCVFLLSTRGAMTVGDALVAAVINVAALGLWGAAAWGLSARVLLSLRPAWQALVQPVCAFAYAFLWYFTVTVLLGWRNGDFAGAFSVQPFSTVAFVWQMFQGLTVYALVVALAAIQRLWRERPAPQAEPANGARRLLVRTEDEFVSVPVADILCIERAGDYAQIVTATRQHLTRKSLAELERQLPHGRFLRVHRAHLINLDAVESVEPIGGGRLRVHLSGGSSVATSRGGAQTL